MGETVSVRHINPHYSGKSKDLHLKLLLLHVRTASAVTYISYSITDLHLPFHFNKRYSIEILEFNDSDLSLINPT